MAPGGAGRPWRKLGLAWLIVLLALSGGGSVLQWLGPLPHPPPPAPPVEAHGPDPHAAPPPKEEAHAAAPPGIAGPDPALLEPSPFSPAQLPRIGPGGRAPSMAYAAPQPPAPADVKRIALLLSGFGLSDRDSRAAIEQMPGPVAFAVSAYAENIGPLLEAARRGGHELLASIPMEPQAYPQDDAGPRSLLTGAAPEDNARNLAFALSRTEGAVGATGASDNAMLGERFADVSGVFNPMLDEIARRGLLYVDPRPGRAAARPGLQARSVDVVMASQLGRAEIDARLLVLERVARERGSAIGLAGPLRPATIERIAAWARTLQDRGFVLVPISALVNR